MRRPYRYGYGYPSRGAGAFTITYEAESNAIFAAFSTPPTTSRKILINNCVLALKNAGAWTLLDMLQVYAAADSQAALVNWKSPGTFDGSLVNAPTFVADRHFSFDGVTNYVDTNFNPFPGGVNFVRDSAYMAGWSRQAASTTNPFIGAYDGTNGTFRRSRDGTNNINGRVNQSATLATSDNLQTDGSGLHDVSRSASNAINFSRNGVSILNGANVSTAIINASIKVGFIGSTLFCPIPVAAALAGANMDATKKLAIYNALQNYMTGVGA